MGREGRTMGGAWDGQETVSRSKSLHINVMIDIRHSARGCLKKI